MALDWSDSPSRNAPWPVLRRLSGNHNCFKTLASFQNYELPEKKICFGICFCKNQLQEKLNQGNFCRQMSLLALVRLHWPCGILFCQYAIHSYEFCAHGFALCLKVIWLFFVGCCEFAYSQCMYKKNIYSIFLTKCLSMYWLVKQLYSAQVRGYINKQMLIWVFVTEGVSVTEVWFCSYSFLPWPQGGATVLGKKSLR